MDYFTKELVSALKALHADIIGLFRLIQQQIDSASKNADTHKEAGNVPVAVSAELSTPVAISVKAETHERKSAWDKIKTGMEILAGAAVIVYAVLTYFLWQESRVATAAAVRSANIAEENTKETRKSLVLQERPWVDITPNTPQRIQPGDLAASAFTANVGHSPAIHVGCRIVFGVYDNKLTDSFTIPHSNKAGTLVLLPNQRKECAAASFTLSSKDLELIRARKAWLYVVVFVTLWRRV
jgi:hypothetical protein